MSERPQHEVAARLNAELAERLKNWTQPGDHVWLPTLNYYTALQLFEAAEAFLGFHHGRSDDRFIALAARYPAASGDFRKLRQLSETWRYKGLQPSKDDVRKSAAWANHVASVIGEAWPTDAT
ncbi:MAG: hypothetical protein ABSE70_01475 [Candidatus Limnocylindrales bacterium]